MDRFFDAQADQAKLLTWRQRIIDRGSYDPERGLRALYMLSLNAINGIGGTGSSDGRIALHEAVDRYVFRARVELREWRERDVSLSGFDGDRYEANLSFLSALAWLMQRGHPDTVCRSALKRCAKVEGDYRAVADALLAQMGEEDHYGAALGAALRGDTEEAIAAFRRHLERFPGDSEALCWCGLLNLRRGAHTKALADFDRCLSFEPESACAHEGRGHALFRMGRISGACEAWEEAGGYSPDRAPMLRLYAHAARASR